jgi:heat shock protein HspQ
MGILSAKFAVGQLIQHKLFKYRGVIVDVDPTYQGTEEWYNEVARTRPPKDQPWYHVLVHDAVHNTYVAERNLEPDLSGEPINHPLVEGYFRDMRDGLYVPHDPAN